MSIGPLLDRTCEIWGSVRANPEVEDTADAEAVVFAGVACRVDSILYRRSVDDAVSGGMQGVKRAIIYIQDSRLRYPTNFNENNWIVQNSIVYQIVTIDEADDMIGMHHFEVNVAAGVDR